MDYLTRPATLLLVWVCLGLGAGCGKNSAQKEVDAALKQPGAAGVMTAIENREFDKAVNAWMSLRLAATNEQQQVQFAILTQEAKLKLYDPATTNAAAAEALKTIRMMTGGMR
jgi:hypothetical protein